MSVKSTFLITGALALVAGCMDLNGGDRMNTLVLNSAFQSVPVGFSANSTSFDASGDVGPFFPAPMDGHERGENRGPGSGEHRDGFGGPALHGMLMGGGLGPDFMGRIPFGHGLGRGPFGLYNLPAACTFSGTTGRVSCPDTTRGGLTISLSFAFADTAGAAQPSFDTLTTNSVNTKVHVSGTRIRRDSATSTVNHTSDRTVSGLAPGSTQRTINGTASASETTTGVRDSVHFTAVRTASDTTSGLVIPIADGHPTVPKAGTVIRNMSVTITPDSTAPVTHTRREQITFDGTNVIKIMITQDGTTKNCSITLPARRLTCE